MEGKWVGYNGNYYLVLDTNEDIDSEIALDLLDILINQAYLSNTVNYNPGSKATGKIVSTEKMTGSGRLVKPHQRVDLSKKRYVLYVRHRHSNVLCVALQYFQFQQLNKVY